MSHVLYNPKSTAPAVYIPAWLSQVPSSLLTPNCKLVYGRLAQWANALGKAHRSALQLSQELGIPTRSIERAIQELKDCGLIGSYQEQDGGHNHFEFYHHRWMNEPINKNLCYQSDNFTPSAKLAEPSATVAEPSANLAVHKIKEIKGNKKNSVGKGETEVSHTHNSNLKKLKKAKAEQLALEDEEVQELFKAKFEGREVNLQEIFDSCREHYEQKSLWATKKRFIEWLKREKQENYEQKDSYKGKKKTAPPHIIEYQSYVSQFNSDKFLNLKPKDAVHLSYEEWICQQNKNAKKSCSI